jgi:hypothetical protein
MVLHQASRDSTETRSLWLNQYEQSTKPLYKGPDGALYTLVVNADGSNVGSPYLLPVLYINPDGILHANADGSEVYLPWLLPVRRNPVSRLPC